MIYVPGYRATFDQVMILMGSWAHFLVRQYPVIAFSWPTGTWVWNYLTDCPRARAFVPDIARLIALVASGGAGVRVVAKSTLTSVARLSGRTSREKSSRSSCTTIGDGTIVRTTLPLQEAERAARASAATAARRLIRFRRADI